MKKLINFVSVSVLLTVLALCASSCEKDRVGNEPGTEMLEFSVSEAQITSNTISLKVIPSVTEATYYAGLLETAMFNGLSDEQIIDSIKKKNDFVNGLVKGEQMIEKNGLQSNTSYAVYCFGYVGQTSSITSKLFKSEELMTLEGEKMFSFDVKDVMQTSASCVIKPNFEGTYLCGYFEWSVFEKEYNCDFDAFLKKELDWYKYLAENYGNDWTKYLADDLVTGETTLDSKKRNSLLKWDAEYMFYAHGINPDGTSTSSIEYKKFRTLPSESKDLTFEIAIKDTLANGIQALITPSNKDEKYFVSIQKSRYVEWWTDPSNGVTEDDMMFELVEGRFYANELEDYIHQGDYELNEENYPLRQNTDYYLIVFGYSNGPTTKVTLVPFHTKEEQ